MEDITHYSLDHAVEHLSTFVRRHDALADSLRTLLDAQALKNAVSAARAEMADVTSAVEAAREQLTRVRDDAEAISEATRQMLTDAEHRADHLRVAAKAEAERLAIEARKAYDEEIARAKRHADELRESTEAQLAELIDAVAHKQAQLDGLLSDHTELSDQHTTLRDEYEKLKGKLAKLAGL